jgi:outer membrane protein assembly factor BamD
MHMQRRYQLFVTATGLVAFILLSGFGLFRHKKYETPITKETLQPDKILFDKAIHDIEHANYEVARLTLNTLINTYDTSEYLAKAKLAIADSWFREGGSHGLAQAEAEYKDFILFYPNMEEAAESQYKVCTIHYKQMEKSDRDNAQGQRAEDACRDVMVNFPNSKFVPKAEQMLRDTQEVLADKEFLTGTFYYKKGSFPAAASRMAYVSTQYPLFSSTDDALWALADAYRHMGDRFEEREVEALTRLVRDYPLSDHLDAAKTRLTAMKRPVPQADPAAYARMKADIEAYKRPGIVHRTLSPFETRPEVALAAKSGAPAMKTMRPIVPVSVPPTAAGVQSGVSDVSIGQVESTAAIDQQPDARLNAAAGGTGEQKASVGQNGQTGAADAQPQPIDPTKPADPTKATDRDSLPTNHPPTKQQLKAYKAAQAREAKLQAKKKSTPTSQANAAADGKTADATAATPAATTAAGDTATKPAAQK